MNEAAAKTVGVFVRRALAMWAILSVALIIAAFLLGFPLSASSIAAGSIVSMASFSILVFVVARAFGGGGAILPAIFGIVKIGIIGAILWYLVSRRLVLPIEFMAGFSVMVVALVVEGMRQGTGNREQGTGGTKDEGRGTKDAKIFKKFRPSS